MRFQIQEPANVGLLKAVERVWSVYVSESGCLVALPTRAGTMERLIAGMLFGQHRMSELAHDRNRLVHFI